MDLRREHVSSDTHTASFPFIRFTFCTRSFYGSWTQRVMNATDYTVRLHGQHPKRHWIHRVNQHEKNRSTAEIQWKTPSVFQYSKKKQEKPLFNITFRYSATTESLLLGASKNRSREFVDILCLKLKSMLKIVGLSLCTANGFLQL